MAKAKLDETIGVKLMRAIYAAAREHAVSNEELHEAIQAGFQKDSVKKLTAGEAYRLLDGLRGRAGGGGRSGVRGPRRRAMSMHGRRGFESDNTYLVNEREMSLLREAAGRRNWDEETLKNFVRRQTGQEEIRTMTQFNKVLWALKAMNRREGL